MVDYTSISLPSQGLWLLNLPVLSSVSDVILFDSLGYIGDSHQQKVPIEDYCSIDGMVESRKARRT